MLNPVARRTDLGPRIPVMERNTSESQTGNVDFIRVGGEYLMLIAYEPDGRKHSSLFEVNRLKKSMGEPSASVSDIIGRASLESAGNELWCTFESQATGLKKSFPISLALLCRSLGVTSIVEGRHR
jgi:hypothetical protein